MDASAVTIIAVVKDLMIIFSLALLIMVLAALGVLIVRLTTLLRSVKRTADNLEETSGLVLSSARNVSQSLGFLGTINRTISRAAGRFRGEEEK